MLDIGRSGKGADVRKGGLKSKMPAPPQT